MKIDDNSADVTGAKDRLTQVQCNITHEDILANSPKLSSENVNAIMAEIMKNKKYYKRSLIDLAIRTCFSE